MPGQKKVLPNTSAQRNIMWALARNGGPMGPKEVAKLVNSSYSSVRQMLRRMLDEGFLKQPERGLYALSDEIAAMNLGLSFWRKSAESAKEKLEQLEDVVWEERLNQLVSNVARGSHVSHRFADGYVGAGDAGEQHHSDEEVRTPAAMMLAWTQGRTIPRDQGYWTRVRGTSMEPWLPDGTPIFVELTDDIIDGGRYVIYMDDEDGEIVKRIERLSGSALRIISDNPSHPTRTLHGVEDASEDMYEDREHDVRLRIRVKGRVLFPPDTSHAILRTIMTLSNLT
jgi:phage repressor protein C with HTH and peptisase S24 domain